MCVQQNPAKLKNGFFVDFDESGTVWGGLVKGRTTKGNSGCGTVNHCRCSDQLIVAKLKLYNNQTLVLNTSMY